MAEFPSHPDAIEPGWLTGRLRAAGLLAAGAVSAFRWEPIGTGQVGDSVRIHLEYDAPFAGPATLAAKFPAADETSRNTAAMFGLYRKEVSFYRDIAPHVAVRLPRVLAAEVDESGARFILLFEDLGPARGGNQLAGCGIEDAREGIRQAAALHAPSWHNEGLLELDWIRPVSGVSEQVLALYPHAQAIFRERYADTLEPELMAICEGLADAGELWFMRASAPQCVVHGDFRLDNMLFDIKGGREPIAILDWQTVAVGAAMIDIGYFLGCGIGDALRRKHEGELLDLYLEEMAKRGVRLSRDTMWEEYRIGALHGVSTAVFSAAYVERTPRGDENFLSMARGACALALEHDSLGALKSSKERI
ncbi:MAG: phosphotransferase [Sphingomonadales bacterium]|nr:phosphotransferase [Sphingomonadales bacterium]MDE2569766.1 phosphotransferase [Sphingomonadales bacterium]